MTRGDLRDVPGETQSQDSFAFLRELIERRERWQGEQRIRETYTDYHAPERSRLPALRSDNGWVTEYRRLALPAPCWASRLLEAVEPPLRGTALAFAGGFLASAFGLVAVAVSVPVPYVKWVHAALEGPPAEAEWLEKTPRILPIAGEPSPSADGIARAIAALRYETASSAREPSPAELKSNEGAGDAKEHSSPEPGETSAPLTLTASPTIASEPVNAEPSAAEPSAAEPSAPPVVAAPHAAPAAEPVTKPVAEPSPLPEERKTATSSTRKDKPPQPRTAAAEERRPPPRPAAQANEGAQRTAPSSKIARLKEAPAHLRGPEDGTVSPPAPPKKLAKKATAAAHGKAPPRTAQVRPPPPPRAVLVLPPPEQPGFFQSIGRFFGL